MTDTQAVRAGRLFDGHRFREEAIVLVQDGRIVDVAGDAGGLPIQDLGDDVTLLPGLVDAHVHLSFDASLDLLTGFEVDDDALLQRMRESAVTTLMAGVTTVRDLGDRSFLAVTLAREIAAGRTQGPHILAAGPPLTTPGGHCWFLGGEVDGRDAMLRAVAARAAAGCSDVKVMVSGGHITPGSLPWEAQFGVEDLSASVEEAHRLGLRAAAHVHGASSVEAAVTAGFDTLEHVTFVSPDGIDVDPTVLQRIADTGAVVSVTAGALAHYAPPPAIAARMQAVMGTMLRLHELGARMVVGSDAGVGPGKPHGVTPHALRTLLDGGVSVSAGLRMMTSAAAEALGLEGVKGVLAAGADADLLAVRGDPERDSNVLHDVVGVWSGGVRVR